MGKVEKFKEEDGMDGWPPLSGIFQQQRWLEEEADMPNKINTSPLALC